MSFETIKPKSNIELKILSDSKESIKKDLRNPDSIIQVTENFNIDMY